MVDLEQLAHIADDDFAVDQLQTVEWRHGTSGILDIEVFALNGSVDCLFDFHLALQHIVDGEGGNLASRQLHEPFVDDFG